MESRSEGSYLKKISLDWYEKKSSFWKYKASLVTKRNQIFKTALTYFVYSNWYFVDIRISVSYHWACVKTTPCRVSVKEQCKAKGRVQWERRKVRIYRRVNSKQPGQPIRNETLSMEISLRWVFQSQIFHVATTASISSDSKPSELLWFIYRNLTIQLHFSANLWYIHGLYQTKALPSCAKHF